MFRVIRSQIKSSPLRRRSLIVPLVVAITIVGASIIGYYTYQKAHQVLLDKLKDHALQDVREGVQDFDRWMAKHKAEVETIANTPTVRSLDWSEIQPYFVQEAERIEPFNILVFFDEEGRFYTSEGKSGDAKDRVYRQRAMDGLLNISDPFISRSTGLLQVVIAAPVTPDAPADLTPKAAIAAPIPLDQLYQAIEHLSYGPNSYAFILDAQGVPIVPRNLKAFEFESADPTSLLESKNPILKQLAQRMVNRQQGIDLLAWPDQKNYIVYLPLEEADWSIALVIPRRNIEQDLEALKVLALMIVTLVLSMLLIVWQVQSWEQNSLREAKTKADRTAGDLAQALSELQRTQAQLVQTEKMSSLGQLVAGVAHEFNNPVNFIHGNLIHAHQYFTDLIDLIKKYQNQVPEPSPEIKDKLEAIDWEFLQDDLPHLLTSMQAGTERVRQLVKGLRTFSSLDEDGRKSINIHEHLDMTLTIISNRLYLKYNAQEIKVIRDYGNLPLLQCYPGLLNQVFLNLLTNAIDAINEAAEQNKWSDPLADPPQIQIYTSRLKTDQIEIRIRDNGIGIPESIGDRVFDPFFTTKAVGKGTGLGLATSYQIVVTQHHGYLGYESTLNQGTEFYLHLPLVI